MPFKITPSKDKIKLVWTEPDGSMDASWTILSEDDETKQLDVLEKALAFVRRQRGEQSALPVQYAHHDAPINEVIPMGPPHLSDLPAGGAVPEVGWAKLAGLTAPPPIPEASANGPMGWEYIPADEL